jgi:hypothetical protein
MWNPEETYIRDESAAMLRVGAVAKKRGGRRVKVTAKNPVKRRSASAAALADARYRKRVVNSAKTYRRQKTPAAQKDDEQNG